MDEYADNEPLWSQLDAKAYVQIDTLCMRLFEYCCEEKRACQEFRV